MGTQKVGHPLDTFTKHYSHFLGPNVFLYYFFVLILLIFLKKENLGVKKLVLEILLFLSQKIGCSAFPVAMGHIVSSGKRRYFLLQFL